MMISLISVRGPEQSQRARRGEFDTQHGLAAGQPHGGDICRPEGGLLGEQEPLHGVERRRVAPGTCRGRRDVGRTQWHAGARASRGRTEAGDVDVIRRGQRPDNAEQARIDLPGGQVAAAGRRYANVASATGAYTLVRRLPNSSRTAAVDTITSLPSGPAIPALSMSRRPDGIPWLCSTAHISGSQATIAAGSTCRAIHPAAAVRAAAVAAIAASPGARPLSAAP